jgi:hypothetical protein
MAGTASWGTAMERNAPSRPELGLSTSGAPRDVVAEEKIRFTSSILPKWARRTKSLDPLLPLLYLRGASTGDFQEVLGALLGMDAPNI